LKFIGKYLGVGNLNH